MRRGFLSDECFGISPTEGTPAAVHEAYVASQLDKSPQAKLEWLAAHPKFVVDGVSVMVEEELILVDKLRPRTVVMGLDPASRTVQAAIRGNPRLERLALTAPADVGWLGELRKLHTLELSQCGMNAAVGLDALTQVRRLEFEGSEFPVLPAAMALAEAHIDCIDAPSFTLARVASQAKLATLRVATSRALGKKGMTCKPIAGFTSLEVLDLGGTPLTDVERLAGLTRLRTLAVTGKVSRKPEHLDVRELTALRQLSATGVRLDGLETTVALTSLQATVPDLDVLAKHHALETLTLDEAPAGLDVGKLARLPKLRQLDLGWEYAWTREQLAAIRANPALRLYDGDAYRTPDEIGAA